MKPARSQSKILAAIVASVFLAAGGCHLHLHVAGNYYSGYSRPAPGSAIVEIEDGTVRSPEFDITKRPIGAATTQPTSQPAGGKPVDNRRPIDILKDFLR